MTDENNAVPDEGIQPDSHAARAPDATHDQPTARRRGLWQVVRLPLLRTVAVLGAFFFLAVVFTGFAAVYTSRPSFCHSCHIMEPYYQSWKHSTHSQVSCIKCHFAPGFAEEIRGKLAGLVQLSKYVTSNEGPRPAAEVSDASCLRSGCHETRLLSGRVEFSGIHFDHTPHLKTMRRGKKLRCTSCHGQGDPTTHISVTLSTCFLCHFKDEHLNQGLGTCTRCHQIPTREYDLGGGALFDHNLAYERGVDCANCHGDVIRGNGDVPRERCTVCHNREHDLERIDDHVFLHQMHVTDHKIDCLECHLTIQHSIDKQNIAHAASNCATCHPNHHSEQVKMLEGVGAKTIAPIRSGMISARIRCPSCHRKEEVSTTGTVLREATIASCTECHDPLAVKKLWAKHEELRASLGNVAAKIANARKQLAAAGLDPDQTNAVKKQLDDLQHDLDFLRVGNDIHNIHYANTLFLAIEDKLSSILRTLEVDVPKVDMQIE